MPTICLLVIATRFAACNSYYPKRQDVRGLISDEEQAQELRRYKPKKYCLGNTDHVLAWSGIVAQGTVVSLLSEK